MTTEHRFLVLHADDDLEEIHDLLIHLAPLSRLGGIDLVAAGDLEDASAEALGELFGDARAVLVCLSASTLALDPILDDQLRALAPLGRIEVVLLRDCAYQLVPWLAAVETVPADGRLLSSLGRVERDAALCGLAYRLAGTVDLGADAGLDEDETLLEPKPETPVRARGVGVLLEPVAGPGEPVAGPEQSDSKNSAGDEADLEDEAANRFAATLAEVLPLGQPVDDEALAALVELALHLAAAQDEIGDQAAALGVLRDAARRLIESLGSELRNDRRLGRYARATRSLLEGALAAGDAATFETIGAAFERALDQGTLADR